MQAVFEQNPRESVREKSQALGISNAIVSCRLKSIAEVKKIDKWVPQELNEHQKRRRF